MLDLLIRNARICDGTGAPSFMGELGVKDGVIGSVGPKDGQTAARVIDAAGLVLAPGFVDPHTHYDAQLAWDPLLTCSPWHGVTTVVMGNCGVGVAPVKPETREILMQDLVNVEAIPYDVMKAGIDWQWESYGQYLDVVDRLGLGINVAGLVAFTPLRHYVMGEASFERAATGEEITIMRRLLREAMEAGAFGFTTTTSRNHVGYQGRPLA
jgi:N-acyl-D-amino-acid deacylase